MHDRGKDDLPHNRNAASAHFPEAARRARSTKGSDVRDGQRVHCACTRLNSRAGGISMDGRARKLSDHLGKQVILVDLGANRASSSFRTSERCTKPTRSWRIFGLLGCPRKRL